MQLPDIINGSFELVGGALQWLNVRRLLRDQKIAGVDWRIWFYYSAWGLWNLYYYPSLDQPASFFGGAVLVLANIVWVALAIDIALHPRGFKVSVSELFDEHTLTNAELRAILETEFDK